MITEETNKKREEFVIKIFNNLNEIQDTFPDFAERAGLLTEIIMPIYDYLLKIGGHENFQKCYQLYLAEIKEQDGDLNS